MGPTHQVCVGVGGGGGGGEEVAPTRVPSSAGGLHVDGRLPSVGWWDFCLGRRANTTMDLLFSPSWDGLSLPDDDLDVLQQH